MGVVVSQSIKNMVTTCLGFGVGALNTLFLYTHFLEDTYYGLISYLISASSLMWPILAFGVQNTLIKFFSSYAEDKERYRFLSMILILPIGVSIILGLIGISSYTYIQSFFDGENTIVQPYIWTIFVMAFALAYFEVFFAWAKVKLKSVFGNIMKEVFLRVGIMILLILVHFKYLSVTQFIYGVVTLYGMRCVIMMGYAIRLQPVTFSFLFPKNYRSILKYTALIVIAGSVATILIDLDKVMIEQFMPIENVAKYGLCAYIASVIILPSRAMHQITYPLTAQLINEKRYVELRNLYAKSSLNLFIMGGILFVLIISNVKQLFFIIPEQYELIMSIVVLIAMSKLYDNFLGNANSILYTSSYYHWVLWAGVGMAVLAFVLNVILIPIYGLSGAAFATFGAVFVYNSFKIGLIYKKFQIHTFSFKACLQLVIIISFTFIFYNWDFSFHPIGSIILKSSCILCSYIITVYVLKISPELNALLKKPLSSMM